MIKKPSSDFSLLVAGIVAIGTLGSLVLSRLARPFRRRPAPLPPPRPPTPSVRTPTVFLNYCRDCDRFFQGGKPLPLITLHPGMVITELRCRLCAARIFHPSHN